MFEEGSLSLLLPFSSFLPSLRVPNIQFLGFSKKSEEPFEKNCVCRWKNEFEHTFCDLIIIMDGFG